MKDETRARIDRQIALAEMIRSEAHDPRLFQQRYLDAAHAVQSAVALRERVKPLAMTPKHMRTGIDTSKAEFGGLAVLLIAKGIITEAEYFAAILEGLEDENRRNELEHGVKFG